jgi:hypothetical protein
MTSLLQKINTLDTKVDGLDSSNLQTQITTNTNDISTLQTSKQNTLIPGDNITITGDTISSSGGGSTIDSTTDINCNTLTTVGDVNIGGRFFSANKKMYINNQVVDLEGKTSHNLTQVTQFLSASYITYNSNGTFTFQNLSETSLFIVTILLGVESDAYNDRVNWRLTPFLNNANFAGYGSFYTTTEGSTSINRYSTLMMRTLVGANNGQVYKVVLDCNKEGDNTFGSSMNGLRIRNAAITTIEYMGPYAGQNSPA